MKTAVKRISTVVILTVFILGLNTCKKEKLDPPTVKLFDEETITISCTQAIVSAEVTDQGSAEVKSRGFAYGKGSGAMDTVFCGNGTGVYSAELNNLEPNTAYFYEAFAKNEYGMGTSGKVTFTTRDYELPIVETGEVTDTTATTATCSGKVTGDGGSAVTERGFCWSTYHTPKISDSHAPVGEGIGVFTWTLTDLQPDTIYYVCAYATNSKGTNYGEEKNFRTRSLYYSINVSASPSQGGNISGEGAYTYGEECTVTAIANSGYDFENWTENGEIVSDETEYSFTVTGNRNLIANFAVQTYTINATTEPENGGIVASGIGDYHYNDSCTLKARANEGYSFVKWTKGEVEVSTNSSYTFQVTESAMYVAHFQHQSYTISVSASPSSGGAPYVGNTPGTTSGTYTGGQSCTVHANPNSGYTFTNWTENGSVVSTSVNYTFTVSGSRNLVAHYTANPQTYTISVSASPSSGGAPYVGNTPGTTSGTYTSGQSCTVHANPNSGYTFANWTENGSVVSTSANYTFTVNGSRNLVAHYTANPQTYTISVSASPSSGGAPYVGNTPGTTSGTYTSGQSCTVHANPNSGYTFTNWTENGSVVSTSANYTFIVNGNRNLVANFTVQPQAPQGAINGQFTINSSGDKVYFAKGNLQYMGSASTPYWKFADNQWDYLGTTTGQNSASQNVDRDLFGWGTSGWSGSGAIYYRPWDTDNSNGSLYGPPGQYDLTGTYAHADWGVHNIISGTTGSWRTLTGGNDNNSEWRYVLYSRNASTVNGVPNARCAKAVVAGVHGLILFPDSYTHPSGVAQPTGINETGNAGWNGNNYTATDFGLMQDAGAVFLPAAGNRNGTSVDDGCGVYWSAWYSNSNNAFIVYFDVSVLVPFEFPRYLGFAVRLVCPAE